MSMSKREKRLRNLPNQVSTKAREEEEKFIKRWDGSEKREHRNIWSKLENPTWRSQAELRGGTLGKAWEIKPKDAKV